MRVRLADVIVHRGGRDRFLVASREGEPRWLTGAELELLRSCRSFATAAEHAAAWGRRPGVPPGSRKAVKRTLAQWLEAGLLQPVPEPSGVTEDLPPARVVTARDRDAALRAHAGERVVLVHPAVRGFLPGGPGLRLTSADPRRWTFPDTLTEGGDGAAVLAAAEAVLGRRADALAFEADWDVVSPRLAQAVAAGGRVVAACAGTAGALPPGEPADSLLHVPTADWRRARRGDRLDRRAPVATLTEAPGLDPLWLALDVSGPLPPFAGVPGEVGLFAATLRRVRPDALVAHLPWAARHDGAPPGGPVTGWRLVDVLAVAVLAPRLGPGLSPTERLAWLAGEVEALASIADLEGWITDRWRRRCSEVAVALSGRQGPPAWRADVARALDALAATVTGQAPVPAELAPRPWSEALPEVRRVLRDHAARLGR